MLESSYCSDRASIRLNKPPELLPEFSLKTVLALMTLCGINLSYAYIDFNPGVLGGNDSLVLNLTNAADEFGGRLID